MPAPALSFISAAQLLLAGPVTSPVAARAAEAPDCGAMLNQALPELASGYRAFDQTADRGWRRLRFRGCNREALHLIDRYLARNAATLKENERANLNFHAAQVALAEGLAGRAQYYLGHARLSGGAPSGRLDWNSYVGATFAFVTRDRLSFDRYYQALAARRVPIPNCEAGDECFGPDANLPVVERLRRCWGRPYSLAYYGCED